MDTYAIRGVFPAVVFVVAGIAALWMFAAARESLEKRPAGPIRRLIDALGPALKIRSQSRWIVEAECEGLPIRIRRDEAQMMREALEVTVDCSAPSELTIQRSAWADESEAALRTTPAYEQEVRVSGKAGIALAYLSPEVRTVISPLLSAKGKIRGGAVVMRLPVFEGTTSMTNRVRLALQVARSLPAPSETLPAIGERALRDPDAGWRRRAIEWLIVHAPDRLLKWKEGLGQEDDLDVRVLSKSIDGCTNAEEIWLRVLSELPNEAKDFRIDVIRKLAERGTPAALPVLVSIRDARNEDGDVRRAADLAAFSLQSKVPAGTQAALSLAMTAPGDLSLADDKQGAMSIAKKQEA